MTPHWIYVYVALAFWNDVTHFMAYLDSISILSHDVGSSTHPDWSSCAVPVREIVLSAPKGHTMSVPVVGVSHRSIAFVYPYCVHPVNVVENNVGCDGMS